MLGNLMPPVAEDTDIVLREPTVVVSPPQTSASFRPLVVHPRYQSWLARCGVTSVEQALNLPGEIVSGHPDRHVRRVQIGNRVLFLKREHRIGWRVRWANRRAGFGAVSRSEREAVILQRLEDANLPGPHWIAYGEDGHGRAVLLIDELTGYRDLPTAWHDGLGDGELRRLAERLGEYMAELHEAGFVNPTVSAKHVFVRSGAMSPTVIDWLGTVPRPSQDDRLRALATLQASLPTGLSTITRLRFLRAYLDVLHRYRIVPGSAPVPELKTYARRVSRVARSIESRSSVRDQRLGTAPPQRLMWLAEEAVCVVPELAASWPKPAVCEPFYMPDHRARKSCERLPLRMADGRDTTLIRFAESMPFARWWAAVQDRAWRSPAAGLARVLFHLERHGVPVPKLLAFGQRATTALRAASFVVYGLPSDAPTLADWLAHRTTLADRRAELPALGRLVQAVHSAGYAIGAKADVVRRLDGRWVVDPAAGLHRSGVLDDVNRIADLARAVRMFVPTPTRTDVARVLAGYQPSADRRFARRVYGLVALR